jgi:hypothetical protein
MMVDRKFNKIPFVGGIIVLLCGILMVVSQLADWFLKLSGSRAASRQHPQLRCS